MLLAACGLRKSSDSEAWQRLTFADSLITSGSPRAARVVDSLYGLAPDSLARYELLARQARLKLSATSPDSVIPLFEQVEAFAAHQCGERGRQLEAYALNCHAACLHALHQQPDSQVALYTRAYNLLLHSDNPNQTHKVAANIADTYASSDDLPHAAQWYRRALFLTDSLRLPKSESTSLYLGLASIYQMLGDYDAALALYKQTEKYAADLSIDMKAYFLNNYGNYYYYAHDYKHARKKFRAMERLLHDGGMDDTYGMLLCRMNLADVMLHLDSCQTATRLLDQVEPRLTQLNDSVSMYYAQTIRIGIAAKQGHLDDITRMLANSHWKTADMPFPIRLIRLTYLQAYYEQTGDYATAYRRLVTKDAFADSLERNIMRMRTADIMARLEQDTMRMHADMALQNAHANTQKVGIAGTAFVVAALLITLLVFQNSKRKLAQTQAKMLELKLKATRTKISPHFIFNVLNNAALNNDNDNRRDEIVQLSKLIRENLDISIRLMVSLEEEMKFVRQYVEVERLMLGDDFTLNVSIGEGVDVKKVQLPSMLIQTLVENSIVHGLKPQEGHKELTIDIQRKDGATQVDVIDNGPGLQAGSACQHSRTGMDIIRQTLAVVNAQTKRRMTFKICNNTKDGHVTGCRSTLVIPDGLGKKLKQNED